MKRFKSLCVALLLASLTIAGCAPKPAENNNAATATTAPAAATTAPAAGTDAPKTDPATPLEPVDISIIVADEGVAFDPATDALAKMIQDRFGITFKMVEAPDDMTLLAASDDLPDVWYAEPLYYVDQYINFIEQGYIKEIPQEMIDKYPNVSNIISTSDLCTVTKDIFGGTYVLPKPDSMDRSLYKAERRGIFYRKDWAEKLGFTKTPSNMDEFYEMTKKFTFDDPDGNGKQDTWGFSSPKGGELRIWFIAWGVDTQNWVKTEDGTWTHGMLQKNVIEPLKYFRKMYEEGILDPEFANIDYKQQMQKFAGGQIGAITRNADTDWVNVVLVEQFGAANPGTDPFEKVGLIGAMAKDANSKPYMHEYYLDMTGTEFNAKITDEQLDRYLAFHDWAMSEEGVSYKLGFEGKDWQKNAEGHYEYIKTADGKNPIIGELYKSAGLLNMPSWGFELACDYNWPKENFGQYAKQIRDMGAEAREIRNANVFENNLAMKLVSSPAKAEADAFTFSNSVVEIIMGKEPVEDMFDAMVQKAMDSGYRGAIEDVNKFVTEKGIQ